MYRKGMMLQLHQTMKRKRIRKLKTRKEPMSMNSPLLKRPRNPTPPTAVALAAVTLEAMMLKLTLLSTLPLIIPEMSPSSQWPKPSEVSKLDRVFVSNVQVFLSKHLLQNVF